HRRARAAYSGRKKSANSELGGSGFVLAPARSQAPWEKTLHRHAGDFLIGLEQAVAHLHGGLERDTRLLHVDHDVVQRHISVAGLKSLGLSSGRVLHFGNAVERASQLSRKATLCFGKRIAAARQI